MIDHLSGAQTERILTGGETALTVWRDVRGLTPADLAAAAGMSLADLAVLEAGRGTLDEARLAKLAAVLAVPPSWLEREVEAD